MEHPVMILLGQDPDQRDDLLAPLRPRYAVHTVADDRQLLERVDAARAAGRTYDLILLAHDPPQLGSRQTVGRLHVMAPTSLVVALVPSNVAGQALVEAGASRYLVQPVDPDTCLTLVADLLAERLAAATRDRNEILRPPLALGEALLREPDLDRALRRLYQELLTSIPAEYVYTALLDTRRNHLVLPLYYEQGEYSAGYSRPFQAGQGLAEWVLTHDAPLISGNFPTEAARRNWPPGDPDRPFLPLSVMVIPLHLGGRVIGVISMGSARPNAYGEAEVLLFSFAADLLAGVVAHWWSALQWTREHDLLAQFDRLLAAGGDSPSILSATAATARNLTAMDAAVVIGTVAPGGPVTHYPAPEGTPTAPLAADLQALTAQLTAARRGGEPIDYGQAGTVLARLGTRGVGRVVSQAVTTDGAIDTVLWLLHPAERPFDAYDQAALAAVAARGRQALALSEQETARRQEQVLYARLAWRATLETDLALLLSTALNEVQGLVPWDAAGIWQEHQAWPGLSRIWHEGTLTAIAGRPVPAESPLAAAAHEFRQVLLLSAAPADHPVGTGPRGPAVAVSLRYSAAQAPGLLVLERRPRADPFCAEDAALLGRLGQVLTAGIEKLRWGVLAALHRDLAAAFEGDPALVWAAVGAAVQAHLPGGATGLFVPGDRRWRLLAPPAADPAASPPWYDAAPGLLDAAPGDGRPRVYQAAALAQHLISGIGSLAVVPIIVGGRRLGAVAFWSVHAQVIGGSEVEILNHAAAHLAPILWAGQAPSPSKQDAPLPAVLGALQQAAGAGTDLAGLLHGILRSALAGTPATAGVILLRGAGDHLILRADVPAQAGSNLPPAVSGAAITVLKGGQAQYFSEPGGSLACLPLAVSDAQGENRASIGVLLLNSGQNDAFRPADRAYLTQLAAQAAALIASRAVTEGDRGIRSLVGLPAGAGEILARVPALICQALFVPVCVVHLLDRRRNRLLVVASAGTAPPALATLELAGDDPRLAAVFTAAPDGRETPVAPGSLLWPPALLAVAGLRLEHVVPFTLDGQPAGLLSVHSLAGAPVAGRPAAPLVGLATTLGDTLQSRRHAWRVDALTALTKTGLAGGAGIPAPAGILVTVRLQAQLTHVLAMALELTGMSAAYLLVRSEGLLPLALGATAGAAAQKLPDSLTPHLGRLLQVPGPYYLPDTQPEPPAGYPLVDPATRSSILLPLRVDGSSDASSCLGLILIESPTAHATSLADYQAAQAVSAVARSIVSQDGLIQQLGSQPRQLDRVLAGITALWDEREETVVQARLVAAARTAFGADLVVLYPWDEELAPGEVPPQSGNRQPGALASSSDMHTLAARAVADVSGPTGGLLVVENVPAHAALGANEWVTQERVQALVIAPLLVQTRVLGVLFVASRRPTHFDLVRQETVRLFALLAALALANARSKMHTTVQAAAQMESMSLAAHELREPVEKVHMILETALNGLWLPMSDTLRARIGVAYNLLDDYSRSLNRILQLGRLQAGAQEIERQPVSVAELAHAVVARHAEYARERDVVLQTVIDPLLGPQRPLLDEALLRVALSNLIHNGVKFSPSGGVVSLRCTSDYAEGHHDLIWTVEDQGIGIPAEAQEQIFSPYYRGDQGLGQQPGGPGLGLALVRLIGELHDGTITVASRTGTGSRFTLRLPFLTT